MTRYIMSAGSQGKLYTQREMARMERDDVHRWVFVDGLAPEVECAVRKWLLQRLDGFYCDLQVIYTPLVRHSPARTHIVLNNTPPLPSLLLPDEAVPVDGSGLNARDAAKAVVKAMGLSPHMSVCGWPFCLDDLDDANSEGGAA
jgi:hypothetical protein